MKKDILPFNNKGQRHGLWIIYNYNGSIYNKGYFSNGLEHGYWISNCYEINPEIILYLK